MPQIPQYQRSAKLTTQAPSAQRSESFAGQGGRSIQAMGQALGAVAERMQTIRDMKQLTEAESFANKRLNELQLKAQEDSDIDTMDIRYREEAKKIKEKALSYIDDRLLRERYTKNINFDIESTMLNVEKLQRKRQITATQTNIFDASDQYEQRYLTATNPEERKFYLDKMKELFNKGAAIGVFTPNQARNYKEDYESAWLENRVAKSAEVNPEATIEELKKGEKGAYKDLTPSQRQEFLDYALEIQKKQKEIQELNLKLTQDKTEVELSEKAIKGALTEEDINKAEVKGQIGAPGGITKDFATSLRRLRKSQKAVSPSVKAETFNSLTSDFAKLGIGKYGEATKNKLKNIASFRKAVMDARGRGEITDSVTQRWLKETAIAWNTQLEEKAIEQYKKVKKGMDVFNWFQERFYEKDRIDEIKARLGQELLKYASENDLSTISDEVLYKKVNGFIKTIIREENPQFFDKEDITNAIIDEQGQTNRIYEGETEVNPDEEYNEVMGEPDEYGYIIGQVYEKGGKKYRYIGDNQAEVIE